MNATQRFFCLEPASGPADGNAVFERKVAGKGLFPLANSKARLLGTRTGTRLERK